MLCNTIDRLTGRRALYRTVRDHSEIVYRDSALDDLVNRDIQRGHIEQRFAALDVQLPDLCGLASSVSSRSLVISTSCAAPL